MTLAELNALDARAFVAALGGVFEHSPWVVERDVCVATVRIDRRVARARWSIP